MVSKYRQILKFLLAFILNLLTIKVKNENITAKKQYIGRISQIVLKIVSFTIEAISPKFPLYTKSPNVSGS